MKKLFVLLLLLNYSGSLSQDLSIQFNLVEVKEKNILNIGYLKSERYIQIPYLNITYTNLSNKNIYFKKINKCKKTECYPIVLTSEIFMNFNNDLNKNFRKDTLNSYKVFMDHKPLNNKSLFDIENAKVIEKHGKGHITAAPLREMIEGRFYTIAGIIRVQDLLNKYNQDVQLEYFKYQGKKKISVVEAEKWLHQNDFVKIRNIDNVFNHETLSINVSQIKDDFIFLKRGESYTEKINLIGLKLLGQNFEFDFRELKFNNYEEMYNFNLKENIRFYYPKSIYGYALLDEHSIIDFTSLKVKL